ncbi:DMT family transporter [Kibdelosporangium persicum]|uniref:EamA domain-containing membrane protein RarD n=1 Tax=Kibdelosporangium persicum TaxID=2698649 RepID=A0ABX2EZF2_9PSEU|nr:EamA family transporter [Kibdelosporangium persicum]NRN64436.1 EamA domain-containing membrane protein RarD [Kibdelosporangium persicum]
MTRNGWILFGLMGVIWGLPYLMIKVAVGGVSVPMIVFARTAIGAAVLLPLALRRIDWDVLRGHWKPILAFAATEIIVPWYLLSDAERVLSSSMTGLLVAAVPTIGALLVSLRGERLAAKQWIGLAVGFGGVALLAGPNLSGGDAWAIVEVMLVVVGYAIAPVIAARKLQEVPGLVLATVSLGVAAIIYLPAAIVTWPRRMPSQDVLFALGGLAVVCTAIAFLLFFRLIREVGPSKALVITYVNPLVAVVAGVLLLDEQLTTVTVVAFVLILGGSVLATSHAKQRVPVPT